MSTALATIDPKTQAALEKYSSDKYNVLLPTPQLGEIAQMHTIRLEVVKLSPDPEAGDFYLDKGTGRLRPSKQGLEKISSVGGIQWNYRDGGELRPSACEKCLQMAQVTQQARQCTSCEHRDDIKYKAIGAVRKPSGEWVVLDATYELDFVVLAKEKKPDEVASIRRHRVARAETGAQNRVIRKLMLVKNQYTKEEAAKPFVVPRIDLALDFSDPLVKQAVLSRALTAGAALFTGPSGRAEVIDASVEPQEPRQALIAGEEPPEPSSQDSKEPAADTSGQTQPKEGETFEPDPEAPSKGKGVDYLECEQCGAVITPTLEWPVERIKHYLQEKYGKILCSNCRRGAKK